MDFLLAEIQDLLQKQAVSVCPTPERGCSTLLYTYFLVPQEHGRFQTHFGSPSFEQVQAKRSSELVQPSNWFTTITLKDTYFHFDVAPKHRKLLRFAFQGVAYEHNNCLPLAGAWMWCFSW